MSQYLVGYTDKFSIKPGEDLSCMISTTCAEYDAEVVKISRGEDRYLEPALRETPVPEIARTRNAGRAQGTYPGSFIYVPEYGRELDQAGTWFIAAWVYPTLLREEKVQALFSTLSPESSQGWDLLICGNGRLQLEVHDGTDAKLLQHEGVLLEHRWYELLVGYDRPSSSVHLCIREDSQRDFAEAAVAVDPRWMKHCNSDMLIAARPTGARRRGIPISSDHFNGRVDDLFIYSADPRQIIEPHQRCYRPSLLSHWEFGTNLSSEVAKDAGRTGRQAFLVNMPMRAVIGHKWNGSSMRFSEAPGHYSAVHFHEDDLAGVDWEPDYKIKVPENLVSGVYAAKVSSSVGCDYLPFVVTPRNGGARSDVAVLLPSMTYLAYANSRKLIESNFAESGIMGLDCIPQLFPELLKTHPEWGKSLYDIHADGSGYAFASWHRPLLNLRPEHMEWFGGSPRNFSADLCLLYWLEETGIDFDVLTDYELHDGGIDAISPYRVLITGSHPEYCTKNMLDALRGYTGKGGRLMYLGGNGFYWVTSIHPEAPDVIEVRRGYAGTRAWTSHPAELHHSTTGEQGGLWRHRGRPPNSLVGVGFTAQGWDGQAAHYRRLPTSYSPRYSWIFKGIGETEPIGDFGLTMNGAAGDEIDRHDPRIGGAEAVVVARASGNSDCYCLAIEDQLEATPNVTASTNELVRADMVYMGTAHGGAVFSVGSMCWIPALPVKNCDNNVARITGNVLRTFVNPGPLLPSVDR